jgi:hypothetical protein
MAQIANPKRRGEKQKRVRQAAKLKSCGKKRKLTTDYTDGTDGKAELAKTASRYRTMATLKANRRYLASSKTTTRAVTPIDWII